VPVEHVILVHLHQVKIVLDNIDYSRRSKNSWLTTGGEVDESKENILAKKT
jgi:hypothetical protein